jgi:hypothetical protein
MSQYNIQRAFEIALAAFPSTLPTAYENVAFIPVAGQAYQTTFLKPNTPENPTFGNSYYREIGYFQITVCYPNHVGSGSARLMAENIRAYFKRATTLVYNGTAVIINKTPAVGGGITDGDRYCIPIIITYFTNESV